MIHVIGSRGMLGTAVMREIANVGGERKGWTRYICDFTDPAQVERVFSPALNRGDIVINCAGQVPAKAENHLDIIQRNAVIPHVLAWVTQRKDAWLIHVSTDCVFGPLQLRAPAKFFTWDQPSPTDVYGRAKLLGEITAPQVINVRTSFIGPDHGIWKWVADQPKGATVDGWFRHLWTGSTVWEVARRLVSLADGSWLFPAIQHLATENAISKMELIRLIARKIGRDDIIIRPDYLPECNRALVPTVELDPPEVLAFHA